VPNEEFGRFHLNPFRTWLIVVAVSAVSYLAYVLHRVTGKRGGIRLAALLGGAYSSTVITVALARRARREAWPNLFAGSMVMASGVMYLRILVLLAIFNRALLAPLLMPFLLLGLAAAFGGFLWSRVPDREGSAPERQYEAKNPLEIRPAFAFAAIFVVILVATDVVLSRFGRVGIFSLAAVMGCTDVDPFIMGLTQTAGSSTPLLTAASAVAVATASNNAVKGIYAFLFADRRTGWRGLGGLVLLGLAGLLPLLAL